MSGENRERMRRVRGQQEGDGTLDGGNSAFSNRVS